MQYPKSLYKANVNIKYINLIDSINIVNSSQSDW